jgi:hypothetical protein
MDRPAQVTDLYPNDGNNISKFGLITLEKLVPIGLFVVLD